MYNCTYNYRNNKKSLQHCNFRFIFSEIVSELGGKLENNLVS